VADELGYEGLDSGHANYPNRLVRRDTVRAQSLSRPMSDSHGGPASSPPTAKRFPPSTACSTAPPSSASPAKAFASPAKSTALHSKSSQSLQGMDSDHPLSLPPPHHLRQDQPRLVNGDLQRPCSSMKPKKRHP
jgi:hypothetical protein